MHIITDSAQAKQDEHNRRVARLTKNKIVTVAQHKSLAWKEIEVSNEIRSMLMRIFPGYHFSVKAILNPWRQVIQIGLPYMHDSNDGWAIENILEKLINPNELRRELVRGAGHLLETYRQSRERYNAEDYLAVENRHILAQRERIPRDSLVAV